MEHNIKDVQKTDQYSPCLARLYECTGRAVALPQVLVLVGAVWTECQSFTLKFFKVMGKALSGELSYTQTGLV